MHPNTEDALHPKSVSLPPEASYTVSHSSYCYLVGSDLKPLIVTSHRYLRYYYQCIGSVVIFNHDFNDSHDDYLVDRPMC